MKWLSLIFTLILFTGCETTKNLPDISADEVVRRVNSNSEKINSLDAYGSITFDTPEISNSGAITLSLVKPDSVFVKLTGPFGISVGSLLLTRSNFIYYNVMENHVIKGSSTPLNIGAILKIQMGFDEIINGFTGAFKIDETAPSLSASEGEYVITTSDGEKSRIYHIDPVTFSIKRYRIILNSTKKEDLNISYSNFTQISGRQLPRKIEISRINDKQYVYMDYSDYTLNKNILDFRLRIPSTARVTEWD